MPSFQANLDTLLRLGGAAIVLVGVFMVVQPFISAMVFAGVLAIATWPLFERLRHSLGGNPTLAATVMLLAILVLVIIPISLLSAAAADQLPAVANVAKGWMKGGLHAPESLKSVQMIGERAYMVDRVRPSAR